MPRKHRIDKKRPPLTEEHEAWLHGDDKGSGFIQYAPCDELAALWGAHSVRIVEEHVTDHPGTRPDRWWQYEAVEPRRRLGGTGTPASDALAVMPTFSYGLPSVWISQWDVNYYSGIAVDIHGNPIGERFASNAFNGVAIDPDDPPTFESQAAYLNRHGLFLAGEERRLKKADWEAETF